LDEKPNAPPSPPRHHPAGRHVAVLAACTPGGGEEEPSGPVTLKLQDYVIPAFQKQTADQGRQVTVEYVGTGADDEDVRTQLALDLETGGGADVFTPDGSWVG
jgi:ABC-type glycerol-3-phosphate transport system substrate-binding protein